MTINDATIARREGAEPGRRGGGHGPARPVPTADEPARARASAWRQDAGARHAGTHGYGPRARLAHKPVRSPSVERRSRLVAFKPSNRSRPIACFPAPTRARVVFFVSRRSPSHPPSPPPPPPDFARSSGDITYARTCIVVHHGSCAPGSAVRTIDDDDDTGTTRSGKTNGKKRPTSRDTDITLSRTCELDGRAIIARRENIISSNVVGVTVEIPLPSTARLSASSRPVFSTRANRSRGGTFEHSCVV